ncbi:MAG: CD0415/CD1112 family protein [Coriobacteriaceae bacterium]|nr:CD0415/CD1112 family protein [Coriobacteriaceae bacterium]
MRSAASDRRFAWAFALTVSLLALTIALPTPAFAGIAEDINAWICGVLRDTCNWIFNSQVDMLRGIGVDGVLSADFTQMLGSAGSVTMYDVVRTVWQNAILPIGCGVLSFVFTVQLIKVSQRMDGNASMPGVKEVVFLLVFFAVFLFLVQNSFEIMQGIYGVAKIAISRTAGLFGTGSELDLSTVSIATTDDDVAALLAMLVIALISWVVVIVAYVVALVVSWARALQIYVMAAFAPIPISLLALDETRQMGVGYLKNFAAVCLAGVIILVLLVSFPIVLGGLNAASAGVPVVDSVIGGLSYALQYLAMCILLILSLVKSGSWARDIMGG